MTKFACRQGTITFEVIPFGLINAPSKFHRMMDVIFRELPFVSVSLDDVMIFHASAEEH